MTSGPQQHSFIPRRMPDEHLTLNIHRIFAPTEVEALRRGYQSRSRRSKWIILMDEFSGILRFHRREYGYCIYEMKFEPTPGGGIKADQLTVNRDPVQHYCWCDEDEVRMCNYLIDLLLLNRRPEFPLPLGGPLVQHAATAPTPEQLPRPDNEIDIFQQIQRGNYAGQ